MYLASHWDAISGIFLAQCVFSSFLFFAKKWKNLKFVTFWRFLKVANFEMRPWKRCDIKSRNKTWWGAVAQFHKALRLWEKINKSCKVLRKSQREVSRSLFAFRCQFKSDIQMYNAHNLYVLIGRWIQFPYPLRACEWIQLFDPILALPCKNQKRSTVHPSPPPKK